MLIALALAPTIAFGGPAPVAASLERVALLQVDGVVTINAQGGFEAYRIETPLSPALAANVERAVRGWRFQPMPVDGQPRRMEARIRIGLAAREQGAGFEVRIDNVHFPSKPAVLRADAVSGRRLFVPRYPEALERLGVEGRVLLHIRVSPEGRAAEVVAAQTMLFNAVGSERNLRRAIELMEKSAVAAARHWTFNVPPNHAAAPIISVAAPCEYRMDDVDLKPGRWQRVVRASYQPAAWMIGRDDGSVVGVADVSDELAADGPPPVRLAQDVIGQTLGEPQG